MKYPLVFIPLLLTLIGCETTSVSHNEPRPQSWERPKELIPGEIPSRVRFHYASDSEVMEAAKVLESGLKNQGLPYRQMVFIHSGAWTWLQGYEDMGKAESIPLKNVTQIGNQLIERKGIVLKDPNELNNLTRHIMEILKSDEGFSIRALKSEEMEFWWTFIAFDIQEPTLVIESTKGKFRFVFVLSEGAVISIDELGGLGY